MYTSTTRVLHVHAGFMIKPSICLLSIRHGLGPIKTFTIACVHACVCQSDDERGLRNIFSLNQRIYKKKYSCRLVYIIIAMPRVSIGVHMGIFIGKKQLSYSFV